MSDANDEPRNDTFTSTAPTLEGIKTGVTARPPKVVLYGPPGVGKSTWAASAPKPVVIQTEDGLTHIDVPHFPLAQPDALGSRNEFDYVMACLGLLDADKTGYKTVIIDTLDALEAAIWQKVEDVSGKAVADHGFGKGYLKAMDYWREFTVKLDTLRNERHMAIILIGHSDIENYAPPECEPYDRHVLRLHKKARALIEDYADELLFATFKVFTTTVKGAFDKEITRAIGSGERVVYSHERPTHRAKTRAGLPEELPLDFKAFQAAYVGKKPEPKQTKKSKTEKQNA